MSQNITILSFSVGSVNEGKNSKTRCFITIILSLMQVVVMNLIAKHI